VPDRMYGRQSFVLGSDSGGGVLVTQYSNGHIKAWYGKYFKILLGGWVKVIKLVH
jgi:hypothetical protein